MLELVEHENPVDHVFDSSWMPFHWDGAFVAQIPEFQIFHCVSAAGEGHGGRTTFADTTRVLSSVSAATRALWEQVTVTYRIENKSHYGGMAVSPLVVPHPDRGFPTMRYAEPVPDDIEFHNRPTMEFTGVPAGRVAEVKETLRNALYDEDNCYAHALGDRRRRHRRQLHQPARPGGLHQQVWPSPPPGPCSGRSTTAEPCVARLELSGWSACNA